MAKNSTYYDKCLDLSVDLFAKQTRLRPKDFIDVLAKQIVENDDNWKNATPSKKSEMLEFEKNGMESSVRKALNNLHRDGKIGRVENFYISITDANLMKAEEYLFNHLRPSQKMVKEISEGTYVLSLEKETVPQPKDFRFFEEYNGNIANIETDLKKITEFILQSEERKANQVIRHRELSAYLKSYIGNLYCYDVLVEEERVIILLDIDAVKKDIDMLKQESKTTENDIVSALNDLVERIYESNHPKMVLKKEGVKRIEGEIYEYLEKCIIELASRKEKLSRKALVEELNISTYQAGHMLRRMVDNGKLTLAGSSGAGAYYKLTKK